MRGDSAGTTVGGVGVGARVDFSSCPARRRLALRRTPWRLWCCRVAIAVVFVGAVAGAVVVAAVGSQALLLKQLACLG